MKILKAQVLLTTIILAIGSVCCSLANADEMVKMDVLDLKNMEISDVIKLISQKSQTNIIASQEINGRVTVYLRDVTVSEALDLIVEAYGWAYIKEDGNIKLMSATEYESRFNQKFGRNFDTVTLQLKYANVTDVVNVLNQIKSTDGKIIADVNTKTLIMIDVAENIESFQKVIKTLDLPLETRVFELAYAEVENVSEKINELLTPEVGRLRIDERTNSLVVRDRVPVLDEIHDILEAFDRRHREVHIEAKIVQITLSDDLKLGVDWQGVVSDYHMLSFKSEFDILGSSDKQGELSIGTLETDDYTLLIEALEEVSAVDILSSPSITVVNNEEAKILVGSSEPYVTSTTTTPSSGPTTVAESVNFIEVGVKLFVTPTIHKDDFITMKIKPEVSAVTSNVTTSNNNTIPIVETSEAETTVMIKDRVTLVIGGLIKDERITTTKKVPLLGDIPIVKHAFRSESDFSRKSETAIFLTPQIVDGDYQHPEL